MKKILLTLVLMVGIVLGLFAQNLTYQAVIRDNNQQLVVNTAVKTTVTITFTSGAPYQAEFNGSTNLHGLLSIEFGDETLLGRDWTGATIAVKVVNAATPSIVYVNDEPRPVSAVPYALSVDGMAIQNYLTEHNYVDKAELDGRHYLTSDSAAITTMQGNISKNAGSIDNLMLHTAKAALRDSVAGQIRDSIAPVADKAHAHANKALLDTYTQTEANLADAVAKKHSHDNMTVLNATTAPYTDADSTKLDGIEAGAEVNVQSDWKQTDNAKDDYIKNKPSIRDTVNGILTTGKYVTAGALDARRYLTSDSAAITAMKGNITANATNITSLQGNLSAAINKEKADSTTLAGRINALESASMDCNDVKNCIKDTLGKYTPTSDLNTLLNAINSKMDSLAHVVDSLAKLIGGDTPATFTCGTSKVKDVDNNEYNTVLIGEQCWMKENLRTNVDGGVYPKKNSGTEELNAEEQVTYGRLYSWTTVMNGATSSNTNPSGVQGICPTGWHVPSDEEWAQLTNYVSSQTEYRCEGNIAKALASATGWKDYTQGGTCVPGKDKAANNATGFSAVPAGNYTSSVYSMFGSFATFWSATQSTGNLACLRSLNYYSTNVSNDGYDKSYQLSVRCLKD